MSLLAAEVDDREACLECLRKDLLWIPPLSSDHEHPFRRIGELEQSAAVSLACHTARPLVSEAGLLLALSLDDL